MILSFLPYKVLSFHMELSFLALYNIYGMYSAFISINLIFFK